MGLSGLNLLFQEKLMYYLKAGGGVGGGWGSLLLFDQGNYNLKSWKNILGIYTLVPAPIIINMSIQTE